MQKHDPASPLLLVQVLPLSRHRRHRIFAAISITIVLLISTWVYCRLGIDGPRLGKHHWVSSKDGTAEHQTQKTTTQASSGSEWRAKSPAADGSSLIPSKIWQIMLPKDKSAEKVAVDPKVLQDTTSWLAMNVDYT